jgi:hypothetical protein
MGKEAGWNLCRRRGRTEVESQGGAGEVRARSMLPARGRAGSIRSEHVLRVPTPSSPGVASLVDGTHDERSCGASPAAPYSASDALDLAASDRVS